MNKFPVNLVVLNKFYTDDQLAALDGSSTYNYPPIVDISEILLSYEDHDVPIKLSLDCVLDSSI